MDAGGGAAEKKITHYIRLVYLQSLLQRWLSLLGVTIGIGGGIVDEGVGATKGIVDEGVVATKGQINKLGEFVHMSVCERGACIQWTKQCST